MLMKSARQIRIAASETKNHNCDENEGSAHRDPAAPKVDAPSPNDRASSDLRMPVQIANDSHGITSKDREVAETPPVGLFRIVIPPTLIFFFLRQRHGSGWVARLVFNECIVSATAKCFEQVKRKQIETDWHVFLLLRQDKFSFAS
jgi:hypothetical protein